MQGYEENCAKCHGERGQGGGAGTKTLLSRELMDQRHDRRFFDAIKKGLPDMGMEAYGETLTDREIWALVVHIREMQARWDRETAGSPRSEAGVYTSKHHRFRLETVAEDRLQTPWSIDWLKDGTALVTNRPGSMVLVRAGKTVASVKGLPAVTELGQGGLMDVAVRPSNGWVYLAYTEPGRDGGGMTKVVRGRLNVSGSQAEWRDQQTIFEVDQRQYTSSGVHFGCRIVFDKSGHVFFGIGERGNGPLAQDLGRPNGKMYRVMEDGKVPSDNPFVGREGAIGAVWSYGHRNPQGLAFDLEGNLWDTEHGPRGGDELNLIQRSANYGWPLVSYGINYNDAPFQTPWPSEGQKIVMPVYRWLPSIGACGLDVARGAAFPKWRGDLFAGGLSGANVDRLRVVAGKLVEREEILHGLGRVRDVVCGPDGHIYVVLNSPDKVVRLVPAP